MLLTQICEMQIPFIHDFFKSCIHFLAKKTCADTLNLSDGGVEWDMFEDRSVVIDV